MIIERPSGKTTLPAYRGLQQSLCFTTSSVLGACHSERNINSPPSVLPIRFGSLSFHSPAGGTGPESGSI
jgi:hypothetical protein